MRRTNGGSRHSIPDRVIPERGKVSEYSGESSPTKSPDVLHDRVAWSNVANDSRILSPQAGSLTVQAGTLAREADVLAGEAAADALDGSDAIGPKPGSVKFTNVLELRHAGPVADRTR